MSEDSFTKRKRALEESFFAKKNKELLEKLRADQDSQSKADELSKACGIQDASILDELVEHGIASETLAAVALVPLVVVAWADGKMDKKEREAILDAAQSEGIAAGSACHDLLQGWLDDPPDEELFDTWKDYTGALSSSLSDEARKKLFVDVIGRARRIAESAGGTLGFGSISPGEKRVLKELEQALPA